jgi:hypothetical protein
LKALAGLKSSGSAAKRNALNTSYAVFVGENGFSTKCLRDVLKIVGESRNVGRTVKESDESRQRRSFFPTSLEESVLYHLDTPIDTMKTYCTLLQTVEWR